MGRISVLMVVVAGMFIVVPSGAARAEVIVDDFDSGSQFLFSTGAPSSQTVTASTALGGSRFSQVDLTSGNSASLQVTAGGSEVLDIANSGSSTAIHFVQYGGSGDNNWDFSAESAFLLEVTSIDSGTGSGTGGTLVVTAWDGSSGSSSHVTSATPWPSGIGSWIIPFTAFTTTPTWSAIDRLEFRFTAINTSPDITLDIIKAVPEPSTLLLLLGGGVLCGVSAWRRRRRAA